MKVTLQHVLRITIISSAALLLGACGTKTSTEDTAISTVSVTSTPTPVETVAASSEVETVLSASSVEEKIIGTKAEGEGIIHFYLTNKTGQEIKGFSVKYAQEENYGDNMLQGEEKFVSDETRILYYDQTNALAAANSASSSSSSFPVVNPDYSIQITFADDSQMVLHSVPLDDIESADLQINTENRFLYLVYTSKSTGETISTEESEAALLQTTPEPTQEAAVPATEAPSDNTQTDTTYTPADQTYSEPAAPENTQTYTAPDTSGTDQQTQGSNTAPVQTDQGADSGEGCIDDGLTW